MPNCYRFGIFIDRRAGQHAAHPSRHGGHALVAIDHGVSATSSCRCSPPATASSIPSRFAADPDWSRVYPQIPYLTLRLAGMACFYFNAPYCLSTIREDHAGFYKRIYCSEQISEPRSYPGVFNKVVLYRADVNAIRERFFRASRSSSRRRWSSA